MSTELEAFGHTVDRFVEETDARQSRMENAVQDVKDDIRRIAEKVEAQGERTARMDERIMAVADVLDRHTEREEQAFRTMAEDFSRRLTDAIQQLHSVQHGREERNQALESRVTDVEKHHDNRLDELEKAHHSFKTLVKLGGMLGGGGVFIWEVFKTFKGS